MAEPSTPTEAAPEEIPEEIPREPGGKKGAWWKIVAVIIAIVVIVSVIAVVYLLPKQGPAANQAPTITQTAVSAESTDVGKSITYTAQATDPDGDPLTYNWDFGDATNATGSFTSGQASASHGYALSGRFISLLTVSDGRGGTVTNDGNLLFIQVSLAAASIAQPADCTTATCALGPVNPILGADASTIQTGTQVKFTGNASWAYDFTWNNDTNHSQGGTYSLATAGADPTLFSSFVYAWGDGTASTTGTSTAVGETTHTFNSVGNFFVKLSVTYTRTDLTPTTTTVSTGYTVRVLAAPPVTQVKYPDIFTSVSFGEPDFLDPAVDYETAGGEVLQNVYDGLIWYQQGSDSVTTIVPRLATAVPTVGNGISADGKNYTFNLAQNVTFHDGSHMTSADVVFSIQRLQAIHDPDGPSWILDQVLTNYVYYYTGAQCGASGTSQCYVSDWVNGGNGGGFNGNMSAVPPNLVTVLGGANSTSNNWNTKPMTVSLTWAIMNATVSAPSQYQVIFHLTHAYPAFLQALAFTEADVVSMSCVNAHGGVVWETHNSFLDRLGDCGTGPFYLDSWVPNQVIVLKRFDQYFRGPAKLKEVHLAKANDQATRELMLLSGDADVAAINRDHQYDVMNTDGTPKYPTLRIVKDKPTFDVLFFGYNQNISAANSPDPLQVPTTFFSDVHVRRAFSYAFNYQNFITNVIYGGGQQLRGPIPQGMLGYNSSIPLFTYDLAKAKAELQQTPYWTSGFTITLYYNAGNTVREQGCLLLKQGLEALTGMGAGPISVTPRALDWPVYLGALRHRGLPIFFLGWAPDYADPDDYVLPFLHTGQTFPLRIGYSNATIDALIDAAAAELNQTTRAKMYQDLTSLVVQQHVPYLWVYQATNFHVERTWVGGYYFNPMLSGLDYYTLSKG